MEFDQNLVSAAAAAKLLSHPARISIVQYLSDKTACLTSDLSDMLPLSRPTVHQHLKALKEAGWVKGTIEGDKLCYCLDPDVIAEQTATLNAIVGQCQALPGSCC